MTDFFASMLSSRRRFSSSAIMDEIKLEALGCFYIMSLLSDEK
jgi:hypothetical protein